MCFFYNFFTVKAGLMLIELHSTSDIITLQQSLWIFGVGAGVIGLYQLVKTKFLK